MGEDREVRGKVGRKGKRRKRAFPHCTAWTVFSGKKRKKGEIRKLSALVTNSRILKKREMGKKRNAERKKEQRRG